MKTILVLTAILWAGVAVADEWVYPLGNGTAVDLSAPCPIGDSALTMHDQLIHCHGVHGWKETRMVTHDGCNTCVQMGPNTYNCTSMYCGKQTEPEFEEWRRKFDAQNDACRDTMEAAMRAMDRFMPMVVIHDTLTQVKRAKESGVDGEWLMEFVAKASSAEKLWQEAKACWR